MYKIYINDRPIIFSQVGDVEFSNVDNFTIFSESDDLTFNTDFLAMIEQRGGLIIKSSNVKESMEHFCGGLVKIEAAGGLVYDKSRENILFIYRRDKWDLPKGKIDEDEGIQEAALREVAEECGIKTHSIKSFLTESFHIYQMKNKWYLKKTYWFNMQCSGDEVLIPQAEENITAIEWMNKKDLSKIKANTYQMIADIIDHL